jgi:diaminohydroxyphosphoribosylaminopyrimidine deaminase/5-amino-6-(5-phosphoribosylamino)uracil reductase
MKNICLDVLKLQKKIVQNIIRNPSVGALIVKNDMIIAEGVTSDYGCNHAEVNAINSIKDPTDLIAKHTLCYS